MKAYRCLNAGCGTRQVVLSGEPSNCVNPRCKAGAVWLKEEAELFAGTTAARAGAMATATGEALTAKLREPAGDVSAKAGQMERESPLFFGKGANPSLFDVEQPEPKGYTRDDLARAILSGAHD